MAGNSIERDPMLAELHVIRTVLQDLVILERARTGMKREELRRIVRVNKTRISRIMKRARKAKGNGRDAS